MLRSRRFSAATSSPSLSREQTVRRIVGRPGAFSSLRSGSHVRPLLSAESKRITKIITFPSTRSQVVSDEGQIPC